MHYYIHIYLAYVCYWYTVYGIQYIYFIIHFYIKDNRMSNVRYTVCVGV